MLRNDFITPEGRKYTFNIPAEAKIDANGFYVVDSNMREHNPHIDFAYLGHDLKYRGLRHDNTYGVHGKAGGYSSV